MSGARFCALLGELGYQGADKLDLDSFEWPFQYDDARPILDWICSSLRPSNVLSQSEHSQYNQFVQEGKQLEGQDLDFAYDSISAFSSRSDNQEAVFGAEEGLKDIRDATIAYKAEALELQKQLRHLQSQFDMLTEEGIYLAYSDFHPYLVGDSSCLKELNQWFAKKLDTVPFRLVAEEGKSKCSWVSLNDVSNSVVRGLEKPHHQRVSELQRLRSIFGASERQWVEAQVENAKQQAILMALKSQISSDEVHIHLDLYSLGRRHTELEGELSNLYLKEEKLLSEEFIEAFVSLLKYPFVGLFIPAAFLERKKISNV
ncbi:hypothetical protein DITRI_Ditri11bG0057600 [Diplodiscus trichospermus]